MEYPKTAEEPERAGAFQERVTKRMDTRATSRSRGTEGSVSLRVPETSPDGATPTASRRDGDRVRGVVEIVSEFTSNETRT